MMNKAKWPIFFVIIGLYVLGIIGIAWSTYSSVPTQNQSPLIETIKLVFIMLGGLGIILPTYLSTWQSLENAIIQRDLNNRYITENTFDILAKWDNAQLLAARKFTRELKDKKDSLSPNDLRTKIKEDADLRQSVVLLFNYFDLIRISIESKRIETKTIKSSLGETIVDICKRFEPWIEEQGKESQEDIKRLKAQME